MEVLPELRLAFSYFTPSEIDETAKKIAALYGKTKLDVKKNLTIYDDIYAQGEELEKQICEALEDFSIFTEAENDRKS